MSATPAGVPWDVYREIHKAMRHALFGVTTQAGATDATDDMGIAALVNEWADVRMVLDGHHHHEDSFCDHLVQQHAPALRERLETAHDEADACIDAISDLMSRLALTSGEFDRWRLLRQLHLDLSDFTALYLGHLRFEEDEVMPALNAAMTDDELAEVTNLIRGSVPPPEMCVFIRYMAPSMNFAERLDMLGGMYQFAPPEIFEMFRDAAERCLSPEQYTAVARAAGFA